MLRNRQSLRHVTVVKFQYFQNYILLKVVRINVQSLLAIDFVKFQLEKVEFLYLYCRVHFLPDSQ